MLRQSLRVGRQLPPEAPAPTAESALGRTFLHRGKYPRWRFSDILSAIVFRLASAALTDCTESFLRAGIVGEDEGVTDVPNSNCG